MAQNDLLCNNIITENLPRPVVSNCAEYLGYTGKNVPVGGLCSVFE